MKKLMIAAAIVCAAAFAQATSVNWEISSGWVTPDGNDDLVATAYAFDAVTYDWSALSTALAGGSKAGLANAIASGDLAAGSFSASNNESGSNQIAGDGADPEYASMYMILVGSDGTDEYFYTINYDEVKITEGVKGSHATFALSDDVITGEIGSTGWTKIGGEEPIPEPTSGLLMLLGMGALALRRRRA